MKIFKKVPAYDKKYSYLLSYAGIEKEDENTVLFIDEIQESPDLISAVKYICENHPNLKKLLLVLC